MADGALGDIASLKGKVSEAEWQVRVDLAALYRLVALRGWDDMIHTHISARIPGPEHHFLINPYGLFFSEITASSLVKIDLEGMIVQETDYAINPAASPSTRRSTPRVKTPSLSCTCTPIRGARWRPARTAFCH